MSDEAYLRELSEIGRRHGLGLTGNVQLYELTQEDYLFDYSATRDGLVVLGSPEDAGPRTAPGSLDALGPEIEAHPLGFRRPARGT